MIIDAIKIFVYPGMIFIIIFSLFYFGFLRKITARMQNRIGPPLWQPIFDIIKLFSKENIIPENAKLGFTLWPVLSIASILTAGLMIPIGGDVVLNTSGGIILILYFFVISTISSFLAGLSSGNPFGIVGGLRKIVQLISYEFPFIVSLIVPALFFKTLSPFMINSYQIISGPLFLLYPLASSAFFISILAKCEIPPFHIPDAHQEIVSGYMVEYTGTRLAYLHLVHMVKFFVLISLGICLFFGGSLTFVDFILKSFILLVLITIVKVVVARLRVDQMLKFYWFFGFLALLDLLRVMM